MDSSEEKWDKCESCMTLIVAMWSFLNSRLILKKEIGLHCCFFLFFKNHDNVIKKALDIFLFLNFKKKNNLIRLGVVICSSFLIVIVYRYTILFSMNSNFALLFHLITSTKTAKTLSVPNDRYKHFVSFWSKIFYIFFFCFENSFFDYTFFPMTNFMDSW